MKAAPNSDRRAIPGFLVELEPWPQVFLRNLGDLMLRREPPPLRLSAAPAPFWPDVFVATPWPRRSLLQSALYHVFVLVAVWGFTQVWIFPPRQLQDGAFFKNQKLTYYQLSEYLPALSSGSAPAQVARKGQPEYAKQPIISIPPLPDNSTQTIVNPLSNRILRQEVKLPNLVVWTKVPAPVPVAATARSASHISVPWVVASPVAPPPEAPSRKIAELNLPKLPQPAVIEPPPSTETLQRKIGDINIGHLDATTAAPKLPVAEQRAVGDNQGDAAVPPPPSTRGLGLGGQAMGQLIALGIHPAAAAGPIEVPAGNRRGIFAATPEGKPGAPGTPDVAGGGNGPGGTGKGGAGGPGSGAGNNPSGVFVGGGPAGTGPVAVVGMPASAPGGNGGGPGRESAKRTLLAAAAPPHLADIPRETAPGSTIPRAPGTGKIEDSVFGAKKYYSMILNMPNLTSAGGSWIMRFAELKQSADKSDLTAPAAIHKVDPAYPAELIRARVEGTVLLYAVIHSDGTVGQVRVLRGIDDTLDENARIALSRWHFRPATKNGAPVDLEAVVQIPFTVRKVPF